MKEILLAYPITFALAPKDRAYRNLPLIIPIEKQVDVTTLWDLKGNVVVNKVDFEITILDSNNTQFIEFSNGNNNRMIKLLD